MIDSDLTDLLERAGGRTEVGPPPIDAMRAGATRRRRRRTAGVSLIGAAAVAAVIGGTALLTGPQATTGPPVATPSQKVVPDGMRLVGWGHVAIAVPKEWAQNAATCGAPQKDTVLIDHVVGFCLFPRPAGVESVQLEHRAVPSTFRVDQKFAIDGVPAERQRTTCVVHDAPQADICTGMVNVPSLGVWLRAESSTNGVEVDRILDRILITTDQVGVPAISGISPDAPAQSGQKYADLITELGLKPRVQAKKTPDYEPGELLSVSPGPGTMLSPGDTVTLTVAAR